LGGEGGYALPPIVHEHEQGDEHGFEVHGPPPFREGYMTAAVERQVDGSARTLF
jgi:hypothetical protein